MTVIRKAADGARRGRRPQTAAEAERIKSRILDATADVFAEQGYHRMTVELIVKRAGIARPTFYRYFASVTEAANGVLDRTDQALLTAVFEAFDSVDELGDKALAAIDAYLDWAGERGPLLKAMYAELHDPTSPVSAHRQSVLQVLAAAIRSRLEGAGRPTPCEFDVDMACNIVTYAGFRMHVDADENPAEILRRRQAVGRTVVALLGLTAQPAQSTIV